MSKAADAVLQGLKKKGISQTELARSMDEDVRNLNQQLNRLNDMKVDRFIDVMEHIGYGVELEEREFRKVSLKYGEQIVETSAPSGLFYYELANGWFIAIDSTQDEVFCEEFSDFDEMVKWFACQPCINSEGVELFE